jgi:hypothetical protein
MHGMRGTARPGPRREGGRKAFSARLLPPAEQPCSPPAGAATTGAGTGSHPTARPLGDTGRSVSRAAAAATLAGSVSTQQYLWGLHRILDGLEAPPSPSAKDSANSERQTAR